MLINQPPNPSLKFSFILQVIIIVSYEVSFILTIVHLLGVDKMAEIGYFMPLGISTFCLDVIHTYKYDIALNVVVANIVSSVNLHLPFEHQFLCFTYFHILSLPL